MNRYQRMSKILQLQKKVNNNNNNNVLFFYIMQLNQSFIKGF